MWQQLYKFGVRRPLDIVCNYDTICETARGETEYNCQDCVKEKEWADYVLPGIGISGLALAVWIYQKRKS